MGDDRLANLLAALGLGLLDAATAAAKAQTGLSATGTVAVLALSQFLDGGNVAQLADVLGLSHSGAVRLVGQLEDAGFVRRRHLDDRRQVNVVLTAKGRRLAGQAARARLDVAAGLLTGLGEAERRRLEPLVARLVDVLVTQRLAARAAEQGSAAWLCRACDMAACGRPEGRCPAAEAAVRAMAETDARTQPAP